MSKSKLILTLQEKHLTCVLLIWFLCPLCDTQLALKAKLWSFICAFLTPQQHETFLPNGDRAAYLIGDGAGVGKGRTIAGIIYENYLLGRKRSLW